MKCYISKTRKYLLLIFILITSGIILNGMGNAKEAGSCYSPKDSNDIVFYLDTICGDIGDTVSMNLRVIGFKNINYLLGGIRYNPHKAKFVEFIENPKFPVNYSDYGSVISFTEFADLDSLDDNEVLFTLRFIILGEMGDDIDIDVYRVILVQNELDVYPVTFDGLICINKPEKLLVTSTYCGTTSDSPEASLRFKVFGGTAPYKYSVFKNGDTTSVVNGVDLNENKEISVYDLFSNEIYKIRIIDAALDTFIKDVFVEPGSPVIIEDVDVKNDCDSTGGGKLKLVLNKNESNLYDVTWSNEVYDIDSIERLYEGDYGVTVTDKSSGCKTDTFIHLKSVKIWIDSIWRKDAACQGICDGAVYVKANQTGTGYLSYIWSNGANSNYLDSLCEGKYDLKVVNEDECSVSTRIIINSPDEIEVTVDSIFDLYSSTNPGAIYITFDTTDKIFSWTGPDDYYSTSRNIENLSVAGCYTITIQDTITQCVTDKTFCISDKTGTQNIKNNYLINIYPNPAKDYLTMDFYKFKTEEVEITLRDITGQKVKEIHRPSNVNIIRLNLSKLSKGFYMLSVKSNDSVLSYKKIILQ